MMDKIKLPDNILNLINRLDEKQLYLVNELVVERIKLLRKERENSELNSFHIGDMVSFKDDDGKVINGLIIKINKVTVGILSEDKKRWKVPPSFLTKIEEVN